jgi:hypothetical protein
MCLFLGRRRSSYILGLELAKSEALLDALWAQPAPSIRSASNGKPATFSSGITAARCIGAMPSTRRRAG